MQPTYPPVAEFRSPSGWGQWITQLSQAINLVLRGKMNCTTQVTLTPGATSTVLTDERIGVYSTIHLEPETAAAAAARNGLYVAPESGRAVIYHPAAGAGATFRVAIFG